MRVAFPGTQRTWCCDAFPSIEKIPQVRCPTLVIHGTDDDVIDFSHGVTIYEQCPSSVDPLWVVGEYFFNHKFFKKEVIFQLMEKFEKKFNKKGKN